MTELQGGFYLPHRNNHLNEKVNILRPHGGRRRCCEHLSSALLILSPGRSPGLEPASGMNSHLQRKDGVLEVEAEMCAAACGRRSSPTGRRGGILSRLPA